MLGEFTNSPDANFTLFNGRHPDGYTPQVLSRWFEFLELYVDEEVPVLDEGLRAASPVFFEDSFGTPGLQFAENRFTEYAPDRYDDALAAYRAEPAVRVIFENGAGGEVPGAPVGLYEATFDTWPPSTIEERSFHLAGDGTLVGEVSPPEDGRAEEVQIGQTVRLFDDQWPRHAQMLVIGEVVRVEPSANQPLRRRITVQPRINPRRAGEVIVRLQGSGPQNGGAGG